MQYNHHSFIGVLLLALLVAQQLSLWFQGRVDTTNNDTFVLVHTQRLRYWNPESITGDDWVAVEWNYTCDAARLTVERIDPYDEGCCWVDVKESGCGWMREFRLSSTSQMSGYLQYMTRVPFIPKEK